LFINIKIDREERPDLDSYYQKAVSMLSGRPGGWPLSVFATPDGQAFAGGTYFPNKQSYNLPSFKQVLKYISTEYQKKPDQILAVSQSVLDNLKRNFSGSNFIYSSSIEVVLENSLGSLVDNFDDVFGGFGSQPKFPQVSDLRFLLLVYYRRKNNKILEFLIKTLDAMATGGIYDHIGFGFHRYSVDRKWLVPHFEKMLYDNAQLILVYLELFQVTKNPIYADTVREIIIYLKREMMNEDGGFYSSQDADSEGEEGKFFVWSLEELTDILGEDSGRKFAKYYGVTDEGNFENGNSILHIGTNIQTEHEIKDLKQKLFLHRKKREKPFLNDNIILSWNSLIIHALAKASFILDSPEYLDLAENSINFIFNNMVEMDTNRLFRNFRDKSNTLAFSEDYALFINALLEVFAVSGKRYYLERAIELQRILDENFWDSHNHGYYFSGKWQNDIALNEKPVVTFSLPSPNSVGLENLLRLFHYSGDNEYLDRADKLANFLIGWYDNHGHLNGDSLIALDMYKEKPLEIIMFTRKENEDSKDILIPIKTDFIPNIVLLNTQEMLIDELSDLYIIKTKIEYYNPIELYNGSIFICKNLTCSLPLSSSSDFRQYMHEVNQKIS
ncbi:MAG: thioredoxin domain-containing protein, partial [Candidatus Hodarchaeales archaeon]|jgi:uncharacterized protein YyaL (SSP411 family)